MKKRKRMMRRRRITVGIGLVLTAMVMMNLAFARKLEKETVCVTVGYGDSVWSIAKANSSKNSDVRKLVNEIISINELEDAVIHVGEELLIPIY